MLEILYQDEHCVAVNKPAGMLVHRSWLDKFETEFVLQTLRDQLGRHVYPVHRLDRPTSGVLLFAFDSAATRELSEQFDNQRVQKTYWAVVRGYMQIDGENQGKIDYALAPILDKIANAPALAALAQTGEQKAKQEAVTKWQCLATTEQPFQARARYPTSRYSWVALRPTTGRKHQLRRHLKHVFHPIIGDTSYGDHHQNRAIREHLAIHRLMLHARSLSFYRLADSMPVTLTAPVDDDWAQMMTRFGWDIPSSISCNVR